MTIFRPSVVCGQEDQRKHKVWGRCQPPLEEIAGFKMGPGSEERANLLAWENQHLTLSTPRLSFLFWFSKLL